VARVAKGSVAVFGIIILLLRMGKLCRNFPNIALTGVGAPLCP
jgi:hypothetical protein